MDGLSFSSHSILIKETYNWSLVSLELSCSSSNRDLECGIPDANNTGLLGGREVDNPTFLSPISTVSSTIYLRI